MVRVVEKYTIDLDTILQILQGFHQNGTLHGDLPARKLENKAPWQAQLRLVEGEVISCTIVDEKGAVVRAGEAALQSLRKAGQLNWVMVQDVEQTLPPPAIRLDRVSGTLPSDPRLPAQPRLPAPRLPAAPYWKAFPRSPVPRRVINVSAEQMNQGRWPRNHRMVYAMVDGARPIEKIAALLSLRSEEVEQILRDLQTMRIIVLE